MFELGKAEALLIVAAVIGVVLLRNKLTDPNLIADVTSGAVEAVGNVGAGVVIGVGDVVGIPRTNETECEKALREGRTWDASFACPAGTFIKSFFE